MTDKDDFFSWKHHPITVAVFAELENRIKQLVAEIVEQADNVDPRSLAHKAGAIRAYQDVLQIQVEDDNAN